MSTILPSLPEGHQVPLPTSTAVERIFAAYQAEALDQLSRQDKVTHRELSAAYALILNYNTFEDAWHLLAEQFGMSRATCYRRLTEAQNLFGDVKKVKKEGRRNVLLEWARRLSIQALTQRPPDTKGALAAMKFEASLSGLLRADSHNEESGPGSGGNTSYVLNLMVTGRKSRQFDLTRPEDITDADYELIEQAISENVVGADQMQLLMSQAKEGNGAL